MKTLFTATVAVVLLLLIGWSLFSDSSESVDSERISQQVAETSAKNPVPRFSERTKSTPVHTPEREAIDIADGTESTVPEETASGSGMRAENNSVTKTTGIRQQTPVRASTQEIDPGDMPNEKFVRDLERYQSISHRNYEEILRLSNKQASRKE